MRIGALLVVLLTQLTAGCATSGAGAGAAPQRTGQQPAPAKVTLITSAKARATAQALKRLPYLELTIKDQGGLLRQSAEGWVDPRPAALKRAREVLEQARADYRTFKFTEAVTRLSQAQNHLTAVATSTDDFKLLARLALQRGLSQLALQILGEAEQAFATAYLLGYRGPPAGDHPPEIEAAIKRAGEQLSCATKGGLTVKVRPDNARVYLDGKKLGAAPVTVQVRPGLHHVRVICTGQAPKAFFHHVSSGRMERLEIFLKPASVAEAARDLLQASEQGEPLDEQQLKVLGRIAGERALVLHSAVTGGLLRPKLVSLGKMAPAPDVSRCSAAASERVARCLGPLVFHAATGQPLAPSSVTSTTAAKPVYKRWWFWTLVAAGVAGTAAATAGIYYGTQPKGANIELQLD